MSPQPPPSFLGEPMQSPTLVPKSVATVFKIRKENGVPSRRAVQRDAGGERAKIKGHGSRSQPLAGAISGPL